MAQRSMLPNDGERHERRSMLPREKCWHRRWVSSLPRDSLLLASIHLMFCNGKFENVPLCFSVTYCHPSNKGKRYGDHLHLISALDREVSTNRGVNQHRGSCLVFFWSEARRMSSSDCRRNNRWSVGKRKHNEMNLTTLF